MIRPHRAVAGGTLPARCGAFDCETEGLYGKAKLICLVLNSGEESIFQGDNCVKDFLDHITSRAFRGYTLYAHNLSFDLEKTFGAQFGNSLDNKKFTLVLSGTKLIKASYSISEKNKLTLLDTFNLIPQRLANIGEDLGFPKLKTPEKWLTGQPVTEITDEDIKYCLRDCKIVLKILDLFATMIAPFNIKLKITAAANAKACWKSLYVRDKPLFINETKDERFRESYYGGRTEVFIRRHEKKKLYYYDINSLYPSVMVDNKFPNSDKLKYSKDIYKALNEHEGCARLTVDSPDLQYPVLPVRTDKLIFPVGEFTGTWNFPEIRLALSKGYKIKECHWVLSSPPVESPFNSYVDYFSGKKIQYQKDGKKALTTVAKLFLNSLYGKFAQRVDIEDPYTHDEPGMGVPYQKMGKNTYKLKNVKKERANETIVSWASYVTSYARCALFSFFPADNLYYCDTDSIVIDNPLSDEVISDTEFGLMKIEDSVIESFYVAPKRYCYKNTEGEEIKKLKGVPANIVKDIPFERFGERLGVFYSKPVKLKTALRKDVPAYSEEHVHKNLSTNDDKRVFDEFGNSTPIRVRIQEIESI